MSVWQKTLLYLGLVDEDELESEMGARAGQTTAPQQAEPSSPQSPHPLRQSSPQTSAAAEPRIRPPETVRGPRRVEPPDLSRHRPPPIGRSEAGVMVRPGDSDASADHTEIIAAHSFNDAKRLADLIRERIPVLVNLRDTEPEMVRRLVDFSSGLIYALDGTMRKVSEGVILVSPPRVSISPNEERRLIDMGLFDGPS